MDQNHARCAPTQGDVGKSRRRRCTRIPLNRLERFCTCVHPRSEIKNKIRNTLAGCNYFLAGQGLRSYDAPQTVDLKNQLCPSKAGKGAEALCSGRSADSRLMLPEPESTPDCGGFLGGFSGRGGLFRGGAWRGRFPSIATASGDDPAQPWPPARHADQLIFMGAMQPEKSYGSATGWCWPVCADQLFPMKETL
jgi:hypothetical protein